MKDYKFHINKTIDYNKCENPNFYSIFEGSKFHHSFVFEDLAKDFKGSIAVSMKNRFPKLDYPGLLESIFDDFTIDLMDIFMQKANTNFISLRTAVTALSCECAEPTLNKRLHCYFNRSSTHGAWNHFFASNIIQTNGGGRNKYSISPFGGPAIITTLDLEKSLNMMLTDTPSCISDLQSIYTELGNTISKKENTWNSCLKKYYPFSIEHVIYHLEKLWHLIYISELIKIFPSLKPGFYYYPCEHESGHPRFGTYSIIDQPSDLEFFWDLIQSLRQNNTGLQTSSFIVNHLSLKNFDFSLCYENSAYAYMITKFIPALKDSLLAYLIEEYQNKYVDEKKCEVAILEDCSIYAKKALKCRYNLTNVIKKASVIIPVCDLTEYGLKKIYSIMYSLTEQSITPQSPNEYLKAQT